jgi:hypothetical protein
MPLEADVLLGMDNIDMLLLLLLHTFRCHCNGPVCQATLKACPPDTFANIQTLTELL